MTRLLPRLGRDKSAIEAAKRRLLAANELFRGLDDVAMAQVSEMTDISTCAKGQMLFGPDHRGEVLFFLKQGRVQIYKLNADGKKLVVHDVKPGTFFGEMFVLGQAMADNYAEATEDSLICAMSRDDVEELLRSRPAMAIRVIDHLANRVHEAESRLEALAHDRLEARLASVLLRASNAEDVVEGLSQQDLAERAGATRESVTRTLKQLADRELVEIRRRRITLRDPAGVRRLVED